MRKKVKERGNKKTDKAIVQNLREDKASTVEGREVKSE